MEFDDEDKQLIQQWYIRRDIDEGTQVSYNISIRYYCELIGKRPSELLEEAEIDEDKGLRMRKRNITFYLYKYKDYLEKKVSPSTVNLYFSAIKSFYKSFDILIPEIKLHKGDIGLEKNIGRPLTRKDIHKLVSAANTRERAIIYLMALSGMGQQEARDLTIKKFLNAISISIDKPLDNVSDLFKNENEVLNEVLTLELVRKKVKYKHHTFIPPEASREIIAYLKERFYGRNEKIRVHSIDDTLFVNNNGKQLSKDSIVTNFRRIGQEAGFQKDKGAYAFWRSHALRKYFISTIINKIGEKTIADYMAGHKISNQDRSYWIANPEDLKQHYLKALPYLSIDEAKIKDYQSKEYREIKEENRILNEKMNKIETGSDELKKAFAEVLKNTEGSSTESRRESEIKHISWNDKKNEPKND